MTDGFAMTLAKPWMAARIHGVCTRTLTRWMDKGKIAGVRAYQYGHRKYWVLESRFIELMEELKAMGKPAPKPIVPLTTNTNPASPLFILDAPPPDPESEPICLEFKSFNGENTYELTPDTYTWIKALDAVMHHYHQERTAEMEQHWRDCKKDIKRFKQTFSSSITIEVKNLLEASGLEAGACPLNVRLLISRILDEIIEDLDYEGRILYIQTIPMYLEVDDYDMPQAYQCLEFDYQGVVDFS